ncbi:FAD-binding oxidoreductase [Pseudobacillus wudalianchiensis]|uniref:FAD-binding protein n=1 Tax=Pseudobacillus wudalianchiensis TaxID=1743143 RepID=A0A1B9B8B3_9BACI|nr:FAD-binding oxidoreductase [Bacillus wudalianchiensis]OCA92318.1 FAD-binding protein [Bacillus wudalianchiensis]
MNKKVIVSFFIGYSLLFAGSIYKYEQKLLHPVAEDAGRLLPIAVKSIKQAEGEKQLQDIVRRANKTGDKLSIAGMQHSQGGHTYYPNGTVIDMKKYKKVLRFDPQQRTITVQSGATWDDIQQYINPYGLAVKVMQSQNIFTIGGSLSVNVHGRDIRYGSLIDTVESFRLLTADGHIINVSREENEQLFSLVIGGYGLFGIILDVTLTLAKDELYEKNTRMIDYKEYTSYFKEVANNPEVKMHLARISVAPDTYLKEMYVTDWTLAADQSGLAAHSPLKEDRIVAAPKMLLGLSRYSDWGKNKFWELQRVYMERGNGELETRNNVMRSETAFMEYENGSRTEVLQEYFVPVNEFMDYIDDLRTVLEKEEGFNLLNITIRYVEKDEQAVLSYAKEDMFAFVLLINQGRSSQEIDQTERVIRKMVDVTLDHKGSYYLPYYAYPSMEQLHTAYPRSQEFFRMKRKYDPAERFINLFYEEYGK